MRFVKNPRGRACLRVSDRRVGRPLQAVRRRYSADRRAVQIRFGTVHLHGQQRSR